MRRLQTATFLIFFTLTVFTAGTHLHLKVERASSCATCVLAQQTVTTAPPTTFSHFEMPVSHYAGEQAERRLIDGRQLYRQSPKSSPPV